MSPPSSTLHVLRNQVDVPTDAPTDAHDALADLLAHVERLDVLVQLHLQRQQAREDDRHNMVELVLPPELLRARIARPEGLPAWVSRAAPENDPVQPLTPAAQLAQSALGARADQAGGRLAQLAQRFSLSAFERDVLLLSALPMLDSRYCVLLSYLQNDAQRQWPSAELALQLLCGSAQERLQQQAAFAPQATLRRCLLLSTQAKKGVEVDHFGAMALRITPSVFDYLSGRDGLPASLVQCAAWLSSPRMSEIDPAWRTRLLAMMTPVASGRPVLFVRGHAGSGRAAAVASALAGDAGRQVLSVDLELLPDDADQALHALVCALREARLHHACLLLRGVYDLSESRPWLFRQLAQQLTHSDLPLVCLLDMQTPLVWLGERPQLVLEMPVRSLARDEMLLRSLLDAASSAPDIDVQNLVRRFHVSADTLAQTVQEADLYRRQRAPDALLSNADLYTAFRLRAQQNFGKLAQRIEPVRTFDDLIVSDKLTQQLHEILAAIRHRNGVLEQGFGRKLAYGFGISALFYGDSGTGKTMVAEVLAGALGVDLIKVDLSTVVNKYIGETEKNLSRIFDLAAADAGVLFFDEADALFGKRSETKDAQDRHANIEVSYLLQRLESYPGLVVLATNNRNHLDTAFSRRLTFITRFSFPDRALRERMWRGIWPDQMVLDADVDFAALAGKVEITGANIRNVALLATWLAAEQGTPVAMRHIELALQRELGKIGRVLG